MEPKVIRTGRARVDEFDIESRGRSFRLRPIAIHASRSRRDQTASTASVWSISLPKRVLDVALSSLALVLLAPLMVILAIMIRCSSKGPVLFRQRRVGREGRLFTICKFRTMEAVREESGPSLTRSGDRRVTALGAVLRKYKLDELPQFYNVLVGDMSIVGPRPKLPHLEVMHMPFRPGLTGAATLAFRREEEMLQHIPEHELETFYSHSIKPLKARLDWAYMEQSTLKTDLALMIRTVAVCIGVRRDEVPAVLISGKADEMREEQRVRL